MKKLFNYLGIGLIILAGIFYINMKYFSVSNGEEAPDFDAVLIDGSSFKLSNLKNENSYVLLDFWGSWCPPCLRENPKLVKLHQKYSDKLIIVTIALEKNNRTWKKAADKAGFTWKNQIIEENKFVLMSSIARKYGVSEIPAKFLISPNGKLMGAYSFEQIDHILSKQP